MTYFKSFFLFLVSSLNFFDELQWFYRLKEVEFGHLSLLLTLQLGVLMKVISSEIFCDFYLLIVL